MFEQTFLSNTDNATGSGVKTVEMFFEEGEPTKKVWFCQLNLFQNLGKGNLLNEQDLAEFIELKKPFADSENSWTVNVKDIDLSTFDLIVKTPNKKEVVRLRSTKEILEDMRALDIESAEILNSISKIL